MIAPALPLALELEAHERKELLRFVVIGSVDDGKSTLIGRLLYEAQALYEDQVAQVQRATRNGEAIDFSLFTDGLRAEREQGITIDVAYRYFATARRKFIVADTPGHAQYTRNMATGASTAAAGVVLLDARLGVLPQSRRHAYLAALLGIPHLLVAVNKMDLVGYAPQVFDEHVAAFRAFADGLGFSSLHFVPVSARQGDNIAQRGDRTPWYRGPTVLGFLEEVPAAPVATEQPLRFPVQLVLRPDSSYRGFAGQLVSGTVSPGSEVVVYPSGRRTKVLAVDAFEGELSGASAPLSIVLRLAEEVDVSRGDLIAGGDPPPTVSGRFEAMVVWFSEQALDGCRSYLLKHTSRSAAVREVRVVSRFEVERALEVPADTLALNDIGRVVLELKTPLVVDRYAEQRGTGAFIVIDALTNATVAAGLVTQPLVPAEASPRPPSQVGADERRQRLGHPAAVVRLHGERITTDALAVDLERALFDAGLHIAVADDAQSAAACAAAGLVALLPVNGAAWAFPGLLTIEIPPSTPQDVAQREILAQLTPCADC